MSGRPELSALRVSGETLDLAPAPARRPWMERTPNHFANRCLPLLVANQSGWLVTTKHEVRAVWDGSPGVEGVRVDAVDAVDAGVCSAASHFGSGILTWSMPWLFRTPPGWNLLVRGPVNWPIKGAYPLEGLVETDWTTATFTMNWVLTEPGREVRFPAGEAVCMLVPEQRAALEQFHPLIDDIATHPPEEAGYEAWRTSRGQFNADLKVPGSAATRAKWQRDYFQGSDPAAVAAGHQRRRSLRPFTVRTTDDVAAAERDPDSVVPSWTPSVEQLGVLHTWLAGLRPRRVLLIDVDVLAWALLLREQSSDRAPGGTGPSDVRLEVLVADQDAVPEALRPLCDRIRVSEPAAALQDARLAWDLIVVAGSSAGVGSPADAGGLLEGALAAARYVLVADRPVSRLTASVDRLGGRVRHRIHDASDGGGLALLSRLDDARVLPSERALGQRALWVGDASGAGESPCGSGSSLQQTEVLRQQLPGLLARLGVRSVLDAPCGDANWIRHVDLGEVEYLGIDLLPEYVEAARRANQGPRRRFAVLDLLGDPLPRADLVLCRDLLVHLPFEAAQRLLDAFVRSGSRFLLTTTFTDRLTNGDVDLGDWRPINLCRPPFDLPPPVDLLTEGCTEGEGSYQDKSLGLWLLAQVGSRSGIDAPIESATD